MIRFVHLAVSIALGSLVLSACSNAPASVDRLELAPVQPIAQLAPGVTRTPSGIFITTQVPSTATRTAVTPTALPGSRRVVVQGQVYDAGNNQRPPNATIEWQFLALEQQPYNGQLQVPADGHYRLTLPIRPADEVIITARAPGYAASMARLHGSQLNPYGSQLNFGLIADQGPAPTVPGALGTIQLQGIVYNVTRGSNDPIAQAQVSIVNRSMVQPVIHLMATTSPSGTFVVALPLHTTDQLEITIAASGYQTSTLTPNAKDLASNPQLAIGLRPAPKP